MKSFSLSKMKFLLRFASPIALIQLPLKREDIKFPSSVSVGIPKESPSAVVVIPEKGKLSKIKSISKKVFR